jgi:hypothetical protein
MGVLGRDFNGANLSLKRPLMSLQETRKRSQFNLAPPGGNHFLTTKRANDAKEEKGRPGRLLQGE